MHRSKQRFLFDHLVGAREGIVPFRRLLWCSTCVIVGSTPAVDV
jgi:hypothetical protein